MSDLRYGVYYAPAADSDFARLGARWLGRDADTGKGLVQSAAKGITAERIADLTAGARRYGFHATLKAPFRLPPCVELDDLVWALKTLSARLAPVSIPQLRVARISGFLALLPVYQCSRLGYIAGQCVKELDPFRAVLSDEEFLQRQKSAKLSESQNALLRRWGYPYVMEAFRFHMTLTKEVLGAEAELLERFLQDYFAPATAETQILDSLSLFEQSGWQTPFRRIATFPLLGREQGAAGTGEGNRGAA